MQQAIPSAIAFPACELKSLSSPQTELPTLSRAGRNTLLDALIAPRSSRGQWELAQQSRVCHTNLCYRTHPSARRGRMRCSR